MIESSSIANTPRFENPIHGSATYDGDTSPRGTWWGAIIAGAFTATSAQIIFALIGSTIGLSIVSATNDTPERGLGIGAGLWWLVSGLASLFFGGWVAGRLCRQPTQFLAGMHGFLAWCTVTVFSAALVAMASGAAAGGSYAVFGNAITSRSTSGDYRGSSQQMTNDARNTGAQGGAQSNSQTGASTDMDNAQPKEASKHAAMASGWTLLALVLGAAVATIGGRIGANSIYKSDNTYASPER